MNGNSALLDSNTLIYLSKNELPFSIITALYPLICKTVAYL